MRGGAEDLLGSSVPSHVWTDKMRVQHTPLSASFRHPVPTDAALCRRYAAHRNRKGGGGKEAGQEGRKCRGGVGQEVIERRRRKQWESNEYKCGNLNPEESDPDSESWESDPDSESWESDPDSESWESDPDSESWESDPDSESWESDPDSESWESDPDSESWESDPDSESWESDPDSESWESYPDSESWESDPDSESWGELPRL
ncbi:hypothetical protein KUCAC02_005964 [Chaenocephalus aceratus]|uniref:Uncharacterized protein n=1 Tax=Chaenocephalus aceratus TaxID=36190 RepID=A0ACB9WRL0_CHAAC|nr:hypothetical protein KUCAC02_005964 [Chaenocephalus aceratus]